MAHGQRKSDEHRTGYVEKGKAEGARLVYGGALIEGEGFYMQPTVFADVTDDMTIAREEIFGPVMSVLDFETEEEVMARANDTEFGLAAGVFTNDLTRAHRIVAGSRPDVLHQHLQPRPGGGAVRRVQDVGCWSRELKTRHQSFQRDEKPFTSR